MEETTRRIEGLGAVVVGGAVAVLPWLLDKAGVELPAWCYIAGLVIAVVAIPMGLILIFAPDTRFQSPLRRSQPSAVVLSSPDPSMALDDPPAIPPGIEFYPTRDAMNKVRGSLRAELDSVYVAWAAWYAGSHAAAEEVFEATGKPQRLILLNPQGSCTAAVANFFRRPRNQLERDVETTKDKALAAGIDTYLVDGPITPMVIGEPQSGNGWVRVEIPIPFSAVRPNVVIRQSDYPQLFHEFAQRYDEMIRHPETISFAGSGKREERRVPRNRDALVAAITNLERTADEMVREWGVAEWLQSNHPDQEIKPDRSKREAYDAAKAEYEVQERIAGQDFRNSLLLHGVAIDVEAQTIFFPPEPLGEDAYKVMQTRIRERTENTLRALDAGTLYSPSPKTNT